tara:strand:- start:18842 stop:19594 length:753 start_codon:yes stop_codon:yes gene_type:complete
LSISDREYKIFARQIILKEFSEIKFNSFRNNKIAIVGMGGIGCPISQYLISSGIRNIKIIDDDIIKLSNLNRQTLYDVKNINKKKVEIAKLRLNKINPDSNILAIDKKINSKNINNHLFDSNLIIDCTDNLKTMSLINNYAVKKHIPLLSCSVVGFDGQVILFKNHKNKHICLKCLYPSEKEPMISRCDQVGVLGSVAGLTALVATQLAINFLLKNKENLDKLILVSSKNLTLQKISIETNKNCSNYMLY